MTDTQTAQQAHDEAVEEMAKWLFCSRVKNGTELWRWLPDERQGNYRTEAKTLLETAMTAMAKHGFTMQPMTAIGKWTTAVDARVSVPTTTTKGTGDE
jgi:hypothetical protein